MSKPLNEEIFTLTNTEQVNRKSELLFQALSLLEHLKADKSEHMLRIPSELSTLITEDKDFEKITNSKNLNTLLQELLELGEDKMLKIYACDYLKEKFPTLAKCEFLS